MMAEEREKYLNDRIREEEVNGVAVYTIIGRFFNSSPGIGLMAERDEVKGHSDAMDWLFDLKEIITKKGKLNLWDKVWFRGMPGDLEKIIETGHNVPEMKQGMETYATLFIDKAAEYGGGSEGDRAMLTNPRCIAVYDKDSFSQGKDGPYSVVFNKNPKDALKGIIYFLPVMPADERDDI